MKQKLLFVGLIIVLMTTACKKDLPLEADASTAELQSRDAGNESRWGQCRLTSAVRDNVYGHFLQYNNRGLVKEWKEDYFDGFPYTITYTYDLFGRLKTGHAVNTYAGTAIDAKYIYQGSRLMKHIIYEAGTNTVINEIVNTYNSRGQIVKRASTMFPVYCTFTYNLLGNNTLVNYYIDNALYLKEEFTYRKFNRNPMLAAHGIPYITYTYDFVFSNWWETSDKFTFYDNGIPTVAVDLDPSTAALTLGAQNYLTLITNFDRISQSNTSAYFNYDNCDCTPNKNPGAGQVSALSTKYLALAKFKRSFERGDMREIKAQWKNVIQQ